MIHISGDNQYSRSPKAAVSKTSPLQSSSDLPEFSFFAEDFSSQLVSSAVVTILALLLIIATTGGGSSSVGTTTTTRTMTTVVEAKQITHVPNLRLVVFDLDYTIWHPEMYQLCGKPRLVPINVGRGSDDEDSTSSGQRGSRRRRKVKTKPVGSFLSETRTMEGGMMITDGSGTPMRVFPGAYVVS